MSIATQMIDSAFDLTGPLAPRMANDGFMPKRSSIEQLEVGDAVQQDYVDLRHTLVWHGKSDQSGFCHQEEVGEKWLYKYNLNISFPMAGDWDVRHPVAHAVYGGMDTTSAGFDDAYMRALQALNVMMARERERIGETTRRVITQYVRSSYQPYRFLVRAAVLWTLLARREIIEPVATEWVAKGRRQPPTHMHGLAALEKVTVSQTYGPHDVLFVRLDHPDEFYMVDVMTAISSAEYPVPDEDATLKAIWPSLNMPEVVYTSDLKQSDLGLPITSDDVWGTIMRFCETFDCYDLWKDALQSIQALAARPEGAAVLAGVNNVTWSLPASDLRIGAIGPILAGVSVEAMKSEPFLQPDIKMFLYGAAIRSCYITAGYYEALCATTTAHPVAAAIGLLKPAHVRALSTYRYGSAFWRDRVTKTTETAGWQCVTNAIRGLCPAMSNTMHLHIMTAGRVPWWVNVLPFMPEGGGEFLNHWLRPARMLSMPDTGIWTPFYTVAGTSHQHLAAAVRWTGAQLRYIVLGPTGESIKVAIGEGNPNRFMPPIAPKIKFGSYSAIAFLRFTRDIFKRYKLIHQLGPASMEVLHDFGGEVYLGGVGNAFELMDGQAMAFGTSDGTLEINQGVLSIPRRGETVPLTTENGQLDKAALDAFNRLSAQFQHLDMDPNVLRQGSRKDIDYPASELPSILNMARFHGDLIREYESDPATQKQLAQDALIIQDQLLTTQQLASEREALIDSMHSLRSLIREADRKLNVRQPRVSPGREEVAVPGDDQMSIDDVLREQSPKSDQDVGKAPDDELQPETSAEAFFQQGSGQVSVSSPESVGSAEGTSTGGPGLGFAPPETSS